MLLVEPYAAALAAIAGLVDSGAVRVDVERIFTLEQVAEAHGLGETNRTSGKLVLELAQ